MFSPALSANTEKKSYETSRFWLLLATVVYVIRIYLWCISELWYDEILTLQYFAVAPDTPLQIFQNYAIANNHFLNSFITWFLIRIINFQISEPILRLPSILCGWGTIALVCLHWRKFIGRPLANAGAVLLAISPVFAAFAYQLRGYSIMMFLTTLAVSGYAEILLQKNFKYGQKLLIFSSFLLPLTMPSALMAPAVLCCGLLTATLLQEKRLLPAVKRALPCCLAACLSFSYYLMIFPQFRHAGRDAGGWPSSFQVLMALILGFAAHGSIFLAAPVLQCRKLLQKKNKDMQGLLLLGILILPVLGTLILRIGGNAPFPRVYLALLPIFTFALLLTARESGFLCRLNPYILFLAILFIGWLITFQADALTDRKLSRAEFPQNLLQQYYRGCTDNRDMAQMLKKYSQELAGPIITNAYDEVALRFYGALAGIPPQNLIGENRLSTNIAEINSITPVKVVACNETEAARIFSEVGYKGPFCPVLRTQKRILFAQGMKRAANEAAAARP